MVIQMPPGSLPGMMSLARAPAIKPTMAVQIRFIAFLPRSGPAPLPDVGLRSEVPGAPPWCRSRASAEQAAQTLHQIVGPRPFALRVEESGREPHQIRLRLRDARVFALHHRGERVRVQ